MSTVISEKEQKTQSGLIKVITKNFNWIILFIFFIILIFGFLLLILPKYSEIIAEAKANDIKNNQEQLERNKKELKSLENLINSYNSIKSSYVEKINQIIPKAEIKEKILTQINSLVFYNGLLLKSISISPVQDISQKKTSKESEGKEISKYEVSLEVSGVNYENFKNILRVFENNLRLMDVQSISFSNDKDVAKIVLHTYILNE